MGFPPFLIYSYTHLYSKPAITLSMNMMEKLISKSLVLDLVLMNEDLCFHHGIFKNGSEQLAFTKPVWECKKKDNTVEVVVRCPICSKKYHEAAKRLKREVLLLSAHMSQESLHDVVTS